MNDKEALLYEDENYLDRNKLGVFDYVCKIYAYLDKIHLIYLLKKKHKILELGCGSGEFLSMLDNKNKELFGTDISNVAIDRARKNLKNVNFLVGDFKKIKFKIDSFDAICCFHVLEHIKNPEQVLNKVYGLLSNKGVLIMRVPDNSCIEAKLARKSWFHYDYPYHVNYFTNKSIKILLEKCGFKKIKIKYDLLEYRQTLLYTALHSLGVKNISREFKMFLVPLQVVFIPVSFLIARFFKNSGTIEIVAFK